MVKTVFYIFKEARPRQWIKNGIIFTAIFFSGELFNVPILIRTVLAFIAFCAASSAIYFINDLVDIEKDKLHPFKRNRPIASGKITRDLALVVTLLLAGFSFLISTQISIGFTLVLVVFYLLHIFYSFYLKNVMLLDIFAIAAGFILRVLAGEVVSGFHINVWLLLAVVSASLFLAIGKRRSELTLLSGWEGSIPVKTRATLSHYSEKMLDVYLGMFATATWITYALFSFLAPTPTLRQSISFLLDEQTLYLVQDRKWFTVTTPLIIYAVMRYLQLVYEKNEGESPEKVLLSDLPMIVTISILGALLFTIIYIIAH